MTKREKYYNHIVDDIVKKTPIGEDGTTKCPFLPSPLSLSLSHFRHRTPPHPTVIIYFREYVERMYGVNEDEVEIIWTLYREGILNNEQ